MKRKVIITLAVLLVASGVIAVGVHMVSLVDHKNEQTKAETEEVQKLKKELVKVRKSKNEAVISASRTKSELEQAKIDIESLQYMNDYYNEVLGEMLPETPSGSYPYSETTETVSEEVSTPEPTPAPTEAPTETAPMDICGNFEEIGSGRVQITVTPHDASAPDDYLVTIHGSNGAADNSEWQTVANWDAGSSSIIYQGIRVDNANGVQTRYDGITGSLRFDGPNTLYWTDESTGNYDRGPFSKY